MLGLLLIMTDIPGVKEGKRDFRALVVKSGAWEGLTPASCKPWVAGGARVRHLGLYIR